MSRVKYWLEGEARQNFGDYLSAYLMQSLFYDIRPDDCDVRIIGSCIHDSFVPGSYFPEEGPSMPTAVFWGCGVREAGGLTVEGRKRADIRAVRGPRSADELHLGVDVALGDPALFLPALYRPQERAEFIGKAVCIPHFHDDRTDGEILAGTGADLVLRPNIANGMNHLLRFIDALTSANFILTASLHGAIVAAAYGRAFSYWHGKEIDLPIKWDDFSALVGIETVFAETAAQGRRIFANTIKGQITLPSMLPLLAAAPFPLKASGVAAVLRYELGRAGAQEQSTMLDGFVETLSVYQADVDRLVEEASGLIESYREAGHDLGQLPRALDEGLLDLDLSFDAPAIPTAGEKLALVLFKARQYKAQLERQEILIANAVLATSDAVEQEVPASDGLQQHIVRLADRARQFQALEVEYAKVQGKLDTDRLKVEMLQARIEGDAAAYRVQVQGLERDRQIADVRIVELQDALSASAAQRDELASAIARLEDIRLSGSTENGALTAQLEMLSAQHGALGEQHVSLQHQLQVLQSAKAQVEAEASDLRAAVASSQARCRDLDDRLRHALLERENWRRENLAAVAAVLATERRGELSLLRERRRGRELLRKQSIVGITRLATPGESEAEGAEPVRMAPRAGIVWRLFGHADERLPANEISIRLAMSVIAGSGLFDAGWYERQLDRVDGDPLRHYIATGGKGVSPHPLFDTSYYLAQEPDSADFAGTPLEHYLTVGWTKGLSPHPLFDADFYLDQASAAVIAGRPPLSDYVTDGWRAGLNPHPLFDVSFYLGNNADVRASGVEPLSHYCEFGWRERRSPHALINLDSYLSKNPDLADADVEPVTHYLDRGRFEDRRLVPLIDIGFYEARTGVPRADAVIHYLLEGWLLDAKPNALFDPQYYYAENNSRLGGESNLLIHYVTSGWAQGARPSTLFDTEFYLANDPAAAADGRDPLTHYLDGGWQDGGSPHPVIDVAGYLDQNPDVAASGLEPLTHYLQSGWAEKRNIAPLFDDDFYRETYARATLEGVPPLLDYLENGWKDGAQPHPLFDVGYYRSEFMREEDRQTDPLTHFMAVGKQRQYSGNSLFDAVFYLGNAADLTAGKDNAFLHYVTRGGAEKRSPNPIFEAVGYAFDHPDVADFAGNPLTHYVQRGRIAGHSPHPLFDPAFYLERNPDVRASGMDPFEHFLRYGRFEGRQASAVLIPQRAPNHAAIRLPEGADPEVTVIIPVYRSYFDTFRCLYSISEALTSPSKLRLQVVLADDCPERPVGPLLAAVENLRIISNEVNHGFLRNCNHAAAETGGEFIVFLNNDTVVQSNWLESLVALARRDERNALVGCKLLNPDGTIQEAGGIMFTDGWGFPYGRNDAPDRPEYNFVREVDCVIGACFLIRRSVFEKVGGFDDTYYPAFFEEFDLAMAVADAGYKVLYQPASEVVHLGSASYGADVRDRQSLINQAKFKRKWYGELATRYEGPKDLFLARDRTYRSGTILIVDDLVPEFDKHAGALTMYQYMELMTKLDFKVIYLPHYRTATQPYTSIYQQMGIEVLYGDIDISSWLSSFGKYLDWVWLARPDVASHYIDVVRQKTAARLVYYTHDLHFLRETRRHAIDGDAQALSESARLEPIEREIFTRVDCVMTPSDDEAAIIAEMAPGRAIEVLTPYFFSDIARSVPPEGRPLAERRDIIFVGGYRHVPNVDAAIQLVRKIMPLVWKDVPDARVLLVGSHPPQEVLDLAGERVDVIGFVDDLAPWYARARMSVSPLRYGAGVKGKIVGSLEAGVPVVTTSIGNEGLKLAHGREAMIGETDKEVARHITRLFKDDVLLEALRQGGLSVIRDRFSEEGARDRLLAALDLRICAVCGTRQRWPEQKMPSGNWREEPACPACWALNRMVSLADVIVRPYRAKGASSVKDAVPLMRELRIHEFGFVGPIHDLLNSLPHFTSSDFFPDVPIGETSHIGVMCQDLQNLTFAEEELDLCISQDVFEHIPDPWKAFSEIHRVLKPLGRHVFTIPYNGGLERSVVRAVLSDEGLHHLLPAEFHGDPIRNEGALVFTDFGRDLFDRAAQIGFAVDMMEVRKSGLAGGYTVVFSMTKLASS